MMFSPAGIDFLTCCPSKYNNHCDDLFLLSVPSADDMALPPLPPSSDLSPSPSPSPATESATSPAESPRLPSPMKAKEEACDRSEKRGRAAAAESRKSEAELWLPEVPDLEAAFWSYDHLLSDGFREISAGSTSGRAAETPREGLASASSLYDEETRPGGCALDGRHGFEPTLWEDVFGEERQLVEAPQEGPAGRPKVAARRGRNPLALKPVAERGEPYSAAERQQRLERFRRKRQRARALLQVIPPAASPPSQPTSIPEASALLRQHARLLSDLPALEHSLSGCPAPKVRAAAWELLRALKDSTATSALRPFHALEQSQLSQCSPIQKGPIALSRQGGMEDGGLQFSDIIQWSMSMKERLTGGMRKAAVSVDLKRTASSENSECSASYEGGSVGGVAAGGSVNPGTFLNTCQLTEFQADRLNTSPGMGTEGVPLLQSLSNASASVEFFQQKGLVIPSQNSTDDVLEKALEREVVGAPMLLNIEHGEKEENGVFDPTLEDPFATSSPAISSHTTTSDMWLEEELLLDVALSPSASPCEAAIGQQTTSTALPALPNFQNDLSLALETASIDQASTKKANGEVMKEVDKLKPKSRLLPCREAVRKSLTLQGSHGEGGPTTPPASDPRLKKEKEKKEKEREREREKERGRRQQRRTEETADLNEDDTWRLLVSSLHSRGVMSSGML